MLLLLGCRAPTVDVAVEPTLTWSEHVESVAVLSWTAPEGAISWVEIHRLDPPAGLADAGDLRTPSSSAPDVTLPVLGLAAGASYDWRAVSVDADGTEHAATGMLEPPPAPQGLPHLRIDQANPEAQVPTGYLVAAVSDLESDSWVAVWNGVGEPVWWQHLGPEHLTVSTSFGATAGTLWYDDYDMSTPLLTAVGHRVRIDGSEELQLPLPGGHHTVLEPLPDVVAWPARDTRPNPYLANTWVTADRLYEAPIGSTAAPSDLINLYDDYFQGVYAAPCEHPTIPWDYDGHFPTFEWSHLNSMVYLPDRDAYLVNLRWVDTTLLVDRATGAVQWRLGGPDSDFTYPDGSPVWPDVDGALLSHPHFSQAWDGGLVAFDNRSHPDHQASSIVELAWDEDAHTVREVFRWADPQGRFVGVLGDVRKLSGGDYLAAWSSLGEFDEVAADGSEVWHATLDPVRFASRVQWTADLYDLSDR